MEVEIENGFKLKINETNKTATLIKIPRNTKSLFVPRDIEYQKQKYIITSLSFGFNSYYLESVTFPEDSEVEIFEKNCFNGSHIKKLQIPSSLKHLPGGWCSCLVDLSEIEISPRNGNFIYYDNQFLLGKSDDKLKVFDVLVFARRDIKEAVIPPQVKIIQHGSLADTNELESVTFPSNSELRKIEDCAFTNSHLQKLLLPAGIKEITNMILLHTYYLAEIEFLSETVKLDSPCFKYSPKLATVLFPNATEITFSSDALNKSPENIKFHVKREAKLSGAPPEWCRKHVSYISNPEPPKVTKPKPTKVTKPEPPRKGKEEDIEKLEKENDNLKKFVNYLTSHLCKYEEVISYDTFVNQVMNLPEEEEEEEEAKAKVEAKSSVKFFIGPDEEENQEVVSKIGEGGTSEVFKVLDKNIGQFVCKKVIKEVSEESAFKTLQNSIKEIEVLLGIDHPCICAALGYNMQEKLPPTSTKKFSHNDNDDDDEEEEEKIKKEKTTVALFFEFLPFTIKSVIDSNMMTNTLKVRIAVEVAIGMSHIHSLGMMHRDLKIENIMLNSVFDSKIIDFGLVRVDDINGSVNSMTKGVGTLAYMSPEMLNEEEYDNKTDVYSYGIVLFALFVGRLPKQTMKDKLNKVPIKLPKASPKISKFCIELITKCTSFERKKRPTFDEIIEEMSSHSFELASDVDQKVILRRYRELNRNKAERNQRNKK